MTLQYITLDRGDIQFEVRLLTQHMKKPNPYIVKDDGKVAPSASLNRQSRKQDLIRIACSAHRSGEPRHILFSRASV